MDIQSFLQENHASRMELSEIIAGLDERALQTVTRPGWSVAATLYHLAFWDQRALACLQQWERGGEIGAGRLDSQAIHSINQAVHAISQAVPVSAAVQFALESASAVDGYLAHAGQEFLGQLLAAGLERYVRRSLHRREHLGSISEALAQPR